MVVKPAVVKALQRIAAALAALAFLVVLGVSGAYVYLHPSLPTAEQMKEISLQVPLRIYARNGQVMAQIGEQRRIPVTYEQIPLLVRRAFIAAEDDRFFEHSGFDFSGIVRSAMVNLVPGGNRQGASTITMQTARNLFLTQDRTWRRKLQEIFLTYRMERELSKEEILTYYLNVINFGKRAYGVAAAAELYYGKTLDQLTLAEAATLARIPQAPSRYNPISNPEGSRVRRGYVLRRMRELGFIDEPTAAAAAAEKIEARLHSTSYEVEAPYVAEMARIALMKIKDIPPDAQNQGYRIYTTIDTRLQAAANRAVRIGLLAYDRRHGWRGAKSRVTLTDRETDEQLEATIDDFAAAGMLVPAIVTRVEPRSAQIFVRGAGRVTLEWSSLSWARRKVGERMGPWPKRAAEVVTAGDVVYVLSANGKAELVQVPEASAALVALSPNDGGIAALVGGFDYFDRAVGKFNRATQAKRQPGSGFKPFLYSAALENGFTPSSMILDAPFVFDDPRLEEAWRPENSSGEFNGPMRLREALVASRNLVSIRILKTMGLRAATDYVTRFGFDKASLPNNLTLALGSMDVTPLQVATGYTVFANGGYRVEPYFIDRIEDPKGNVVFRAEPRMVARECDAPTPETTASAGTPSAPSGSDDPNVDAADAEAPLAPPPGCTWPAERIAPRVISAANAWLMTDMMREVITRGTGRRALALGRGDLAGKTGTTNEARDTWFNGFNRDLVASVWVGFDQSRPLGEGEEGSRTAVPIWVSFMREALRTVPERTRPMPPGLVQARISPTTGELAGVDDAGAIFEAFLEGHLPVGGVLGGETSAAPGAARPKPAEAAGKDEPLF